LKEKEKFGEVVFGAVTRVKSEFRFIVKKIVSWVAFLLLYKRLVWVMLMLLLVL
jgi:hypothetical protein